MLNLNCLICHQRSHIFPPPPFLIDRFFFSFLVLIKAVGFISLEAEVLCLENKHSIDNSNAKLSHSVLPLKLQPGEAQVSSV